jgi:signal transduction histidine kinase
VNYAGPPRGVLSRSVSLVGIIAISTSVFVQFFQGHLAVWALAFGMAAVIGWLFLVVIGRGLLIPLPFVVVMLVCGGISGTATGGASFVAAAVAVLWLTRDLRRPILWGVGAGIIAMSLTLAGNLIVTIPPVALIAMEAGVVVAFLGGESRRQYLLADIRSRELIEEQASTDVLSARAQLAHDIHDVLAHSLGGLVIQLDAVDALLESGDTDAAAAKVRDARALAAEGLSEARRAVAALSTGGTDSDATVPGRAVASDLAVLVRGHESLGGIARFFEKGDRVEVSARLAAALRRAVQEGLTNARKHAPGEPVTVTLDWGARGVTLTISNPVGGPSHAISGGGHGLLGMRERFGALPGGAVASGTDGGRFVVTASASTGAVAPTAAASRKAATA